MFASTLASSGGRCEFDRGVLLFVRTVNVHVTRRAALDRAPGAFTNTGTIAFKDDEQDGESKKDHQQRRENGIHHIILVSLSPTMSP